MAKQTKCFNCGTPAAIQVQRIQPPTLRKIICTEARCWKKWWKLADDKKV